jgi:hypothetical protein
LYEKSEQKEAKQECFFYTTKQRNACHFCFHLIDSLCEKSEQKEAKQECLFYSTKQRNKCHFCFHLIDSLCEKSEQKEAKQGCFFLLPLYGFFVWKVSAHLVRIGDIDNLAEMR